MTQFDTYLTFNLQKAEARFKIALRTYNHDLVFYYTCILNVMVYLDGTWASMQNSGYQTSQLFTFTLIHKIFSAIQESLHHAQTHTLLNTECFSVVRWNIISLTMSIQEFDVCWPSKEDWGCYLHRRQIPYPFSLLGKWCYQYLLKVPFSFPQYNINLQGKLVLAWLHFEKGFIPAYYFPCNVLGYI